MRFVKSAILFLLVVLFVACSENTSQPATGYGRLDIRVTLDSKFVGVDNIPIEVMMPAPNPNTFNIIIARPDGSSWHKWEKVTDVNPSMTFPIGTYNVFVYNHPLPDDNSTPQFVSAESVVINDDETSVLNVRCAPSQAMVMADNIIVRSGEYTLHAIYIQPQGESLAAFADNENTPKYLVGGNTLVMASISNDNGESVNIEVAPDLLLKAGYIYQISAMAGEHDNQLVLNILSALGSRNFVLDVNPKWFEFTPPVAQPIGFESGVSVPLTEGVSLPYNIGVEMSSEIDFSQIDINIALSQSSTLDLPRVSNILDSTSPSTAQLLNRGLIINSSDNKNVQIDFTRLLANLHIDNNEQLQFIITGKDALGRTSQPVVLDVQLHALSFDVLSTDDAMLGINEAGVTLQINSDEIDPNQFDLYTVDGDNLSKINVTSWDFNPVDKVLSFKFKVPEGNAPVTIDIHYMSEAKQRVVINRAIPDADISVSTDPFATFALLQVSSTNPNTTRAIAKYASVYDEKGNVLSIGERDTDSGIFFVTSLKPQSQYTISISPIPGHSLAPVTFTTETALPVPDGSFEDDKKEIKYQHLAAGGRYSTTTIPIYSNANYIDVNILWPKTTWASVNDKTFCRSAKLANTWYMQPSSEIVTDAQEGAYAVCVKSVGWDLDGAQIPDYLQAQGQSLPYNANVPAVRHRSSGRLFLGEYKFNPSDLTEYYDKGIDFTSRPMSLNGFYKYITDTRDVSDTGYAIVRVVGEDQQGQQCVIASGTQRFVASSDYIAFNIPIKYNRYFVRATKIEIEFASTTPHDNIAEEDISVHVSPDVPHSMMIGSRLYIDNLSFSY